MLKPLQWEIDQPVPTPRVLGAVVPGAYLITHPGTGRAYVGSTKDLSNRLERHRSDLQRGIHTNQELQAAYNQDPRCQITTMHTASKEEALDFEQVVLDEYWADSLFNVSLDARSALRGRNHSPEARRKISEAHTGREVSQAHRDKISEALKNRKATPAQRAGLLLGGGANKKAVVIDGVQYESATAAAQALGITPGAITYRVQSAHPRQAGCYFVGAE